MNAQALPTSIVLWYQPHVLDTKPEQTGITVYSDINRPDCVLGRQDNPFHMPCDSAGCHAPMKYPLFSASAQDSMHPDGYMSGAAYKEVGAKPKSIFVEHTMKPPSG